MNQTTISEVHTAIPIDRERIAEFCRKWGITEFSLFGSILRDDFREDSDVDVLVVFEPGFDWSLRRVMEMHEEIADIFKRKVDLVEKGCLDNPYRRREILRTRRLIYARH